VTLEGSQKGADGPFGKWHFHFNRRAGTEAVESFFVTFENLTTGDIERGKLGVAFLDSDGNPLHQKPWHSQQWGKDAIAWARQQLKQQLPVDARKRTQGEYQTIILEKKLKAAADERRKARAAGEKERIRKLLSERAEVVEEVHQRVGGPLQRVRGAMSLALEAGPDAPTVLSKSLNITREQAGEIIKKLT